MMASARRSKPQPERTATRRRAAHGLLEEDVADDDLLQRQAKHAHRPLLKLTSAGPLPAHNVDRGIYDVIE
jgi:hypothetical protein